MRNTLCEFLTFAGGAKLECKHSSLAYAFHANKNPFTDNCLQRAYVRGTTFIYHSVISSPFSKFRLKILSVNGDKT